MTHEQDHFDDGRDGSQFAILLDIKPPNSTAQGKRFNGKTGRAFHTKEHTRDMEAITALMKVAPGRPTAALSGAVELVIEGYWPHLRKTRKRDVWRTVPKVSKPDLDNWAKGLIDCLVDAGYLESDQIVWKITVSKHHAHEPRIVISGKVTA